MLSRNNLWLLLLLAQPVHAERIFANGFEPEAPGADPCMGLIQPFGWQRVNKTWQEAWTSPTGQVPTFPTSGGNPVPIPGKRAGTNDYITKEQYLVISFVPQPGQSIEMAWDVAQAQSGYGQPRPANAMFVGISDTPGDFCTALPGHDPCAKYGGQDSLFWTTSLTPGFNQCPLVPGTTYYMNIIMANPGDGLIFGEQGACQDVPNSQLGCDVQATHR